MSADEAATRSFYESLPSKRIGAGAVLRDGWGRVLLVKPTYKPMWEVPGGIVEAGESPATAVARELVEELGIRVAIGRLLVVDWLPGRPPKTEGLMMLFDGDRLADEVVRRIVLPPEELSECRFFAPQQLESALPEHMAKRMAVALELVDSERTAYLEFGRPVTTERHRSPMFVLFKGPPGSGKSTLANEIGRRLRWPVIDKDAVRDLLPDAIGGVSYEAMLRIAGRQLSLGLDVIADSPMGYGRAYREAMRVAVEHHAHLLVLECRCSDEREWRRRIDRRKEMELAGHHATDWTKVEAFHARTAADPFQVKVPRLVIDTADSLEQCAAEALAWLSSQSSG